MIERVHATNFCCFEHLEQPLSNQGLVCIRGDHRDSDGASSNGAGKSTLFKAVSWCLYGETVDGMKGDEVIRVGAKETSVTVMIGDGDHVYHIIRTRRKGKPGLRVCVENPPDPELVPYAMDRDRLQAKIIDIVGLDFRAFKNTVLYGQNDSFKFADPRTKDGERKDMLHRILRTESLQVCHEVAKERARKLRKQLEEVDRALGTIDAKVEVIDLPAIERRQASWQADRDRRVAEYAALARRFKRRATELQEEAPDQERLGKRMAELKAAYEAKRAAGEGLVEAQAKAKAIMEQERGCEQRKAEAETDVRTLHRQLEQLKGDRCPVCTTSVKSGTAKQHVIGLRSQLAAAEVAAKEARVAVAEFHAQLEQQHDLIDAAQRARVDAEAIRDKMDDLRDEMDAAGQVEAEVQENLEKGLRAVEEAKRIMDETDPHDEALRVARGQVKKLVGEGQKHEARRTELTEEMAYTQFWVRGYSPQGLPSFVLDAVMPFLTDRTNEYLDTLSDGDITMSVSTQRELKSQKDAVRDEIDIQWDIEGNEGVAKSGGQRTRMNLAMDLALMDLAASREGLQLDLLMIDEALDGLDKEGTARVIQLLQSLRKRRGSIFVISHSDDVGEAFERGLVVVREGGISRVEAV